MMVSTLNIEITYFSIAIGHKQAKSLDEIIFKKLLRSYICGIFQFRIS